MAKARHPQEHGLYLCMYCLAKYRIRVFKSHPNQMCDLEYRDKYEPEWWQVPA